MIIGFTGTRTRPTLAQQDWLDGHLIATMPSELRHGACVGADAHAHCLALKHLSRIHVVVHPPTDDRLVYLPAVAVHRPPYRVTVLPRQPYHTRNRAIVNACDELLALPNGPWRPHSGTWMTIDYAVAHDVPVTICWPDGKVERRENER